jgi:uncharacterized membrane protein YgcG
MNALYLHSEPYRPEGNIDARAARRALGHPPQFGPWALLLRETLQNSWDARTGDEITYRVDAWFPTPSQFQTLVTDVFHRMPPSKAMAGNKPTERDLPVLVITDHGTRGLGGPTRADLAQSDRNDFVDFIRNIGRAEDKALGGGTYGFGKGILYETSICSTIIVFTRTTVAGKTVSRLMAVRLGSSYEHSGKRFTGRHWWGVPNELTGAEPLTGRAAELLASRLGLTFIPDGDTGTSIMIVGPLAQSDNETLEDVVTEIADAALWWAWPHMVRNSNGKSSVAFQFTHEGDSVPLADPAEHPALRYYVDAYLRACRVADKQNLDEGWPWIDKEIRSGHGGKVLLGALAYRTLLPEQVEAALQSVPVPVTRHIALMRAPKLVVKYLDAPADPRGLGLCGVFIANPQLDGEYALSEPVAHDDWIPANLGREKFQRNHVKQALDALKRELRPDLTQSGGVDSGTSLSGLLALANGLGALLDGHGIGSDAARQNVDPSGGGSAGGGAGKGAGASSGDGDGGRSGAGGGAGNGAGAKRRASARLEGKPRLVLMADQAVARFQVHPTVPAGQAVRITAEPRVVVDGGAEAPSEAPLGTPLPRVLGWSTSADEEVSSLRADLRADAATDRAWVWVTQPEDTAVTVLLHIESAS